MECGGERSIICGVQRGGSLWPRERPYTEFFPAVKVLSRLPFIFIFDNLFYFQQKRQIINLNVSIKMCDSIDIKYNFIGW